jgi:hypothetical protein
VSHQTPVPTCLQLLKNVKNILRSIQEPTSLQLAIVSHLPVLFNPGRTLKP